MKHNVVILFFTVLSGMGTIGCAQLPIYESQNKSQTSSAPDEHMNGDSKMMYTVEHDRENIYLNISTNDAMTQGRIMMQGLTIWVDQYAKKGESVGFTFPYQIGNRQNSQNDMQEMNKEQRGSMDDTSSRSQKMFDRYEESPKPIKLMGFEGQGSVQLVDTDLESSPVAVKIDMTKNGKLSYTASIPLKLVLTDTEISKENISIGVFAEAPDMPQGRPQGGQGGGRGQGGPPGGGGGMGGPPGGGGSPPSGGDQGGGMSAPAEIQFWFKVHLND